MSEEEWLTVDETINRNEAGDLISDELTVEYLNNKKIAYLPMTLAQINLVGKKGDSEDAQFNSVIKDHCKKPSFNDEQLKGMSFGKKMALVVAIFAGSTGRSQSMIKKTFDENIDKAMNKMGEIDLPGSKKKS